MNRFKLIVLLILSSVVGILFFQNQQLLTLKLFCPEPTSEACFWLSPELSLAAWMGLFAIAGILSSLWGQLLTQTISTTKINKSVGSKTENRSSPQAKSQKDKPQNSSFNSPKRSPEKTKPRNSAATDWEEKSSENWEEKKPTDGVNYSPKDQYSAKSTKDRDSGTKKTETQSNSQSNSQSSSQSNQASSDSVYSYKFSESSKNKPQEPVNNKTDDVYDASYRTLNNPSSNNVTSQEEDNEEWI